MSSIKKEFKILISDKLPNGNFVSIEFRTHIEKDNVDPDLLFDEVFESTNRDIKKAIKNNKIIRVLYKKMLTGIDQIERLDNDSDWS